MKNKATFRKIAEKAGVSKSSVALALQDKYGISSKTRAKVLMSAYEMGYDFKEYYGKIGKKLKKIALLIAYDYCVSEVHWKEVIVEIERSAIENGCVLEIINFNDYEDFNALTFELKTDTYLGGIIIHQNDLDLMQALKEANIKCVVIEPKFYMNTDFTCLMPNDYVGMSKAADYLYKLGHRKICFIGNIFHNDTFMQRFNGFYDYFRTKEDAEIITIINSNASYELQNTDFDAFEKVFRRKEFPTALVCANDALAMECIQRLKKLGKRVPDDISVIGYGNTKEIYEFSPVITSMKIDRSMFGQFIADYIIKNNYGTGIAFSFQISVDLIENETTKGISR